MPIKGNLNTRKGPHGRLSAIVTAIGLLAGSASLAQTAPVAPQPETISSELLRQQQRETERLEMQRQLEQRRESVLEAPAPSRQTLPQDVSVRFELQSVTFSSSEILDQTTLDAIVTPYLKQTIGFAELQKIVADINRLYDEKGFMTARAVLPPQRIEQGHVRVELVEGKIGQVHVEGNSYMNTDFILSRLPLEQGVLLQPRELESELSRFNRGSAAKVSASLQPGKEYGQTDVYVAVTEPQRTSLDLFINNHGYESTGEAQGGIMFRHYGLLGRDDLLSIFGAGSRGASVGSLSYDFPINSLGGRLGARVGASSAKVINGPFRALNSVSDSENAEVFLSHPLWSNNDWWLSGNLSYGQQRSKNYIATVFLNENRVETTQADLSALYLAENRSLRVGAGYRRAASQVSGTTRRQNFDLWTGYWQFYQGLNTDWFLTSSGAWQYSHEQGLPSSQVFQIGGAATVRGYRQGELAGDGGLYGNLQLNYRANDKTTLFGFYDYGQVDTSFIQPDRLDSVGGGMNFQLDPRINFEIHVGHPLNKVRSDLDSVYINMQLVFKLL
ncbi:ShlB/FhaC/HecB family hemolysin secretion/activation protein [uncultured Oxalicibacterium sp.]|uniref:ShlB/FhaC/HecB family hemolysin secretion/activation protein n=1 Tax=uncultured Oxalicibacterium sp. TaxID=1168540 RepID=UPI0025F09E8B|nr:ShlB/FhaC/HecB family hemolysin secretion/activation protein [uncultured Oxalicibacterium sp.]